MSSTKIEYHHAAGDDYIEERDYRYSAGEYTSEFSVPYRQICVKLADGGVVNDGTNTETVTIKVVSGLDIARGESPTVLDYNADVTITVDDKQTTKTLTNGSVSFDLTTNKPAGSEIEIIAESLADHPAESDSATIEVVSA